jgi:hypothetical protein
MKLYNIFAMVLAVAANGAAAEPYRFDDVRLGASFARLEHDLDFRDINAAIAAQKGQATVKPDLGRRGYGCARREDAYADLTCVSHDERVGGAEMREIRLQFLDGILQQFSITAEIRYVDAVMQALRERIGAPQRTDAAPAGGFPSSSWRNAESRVTAYAGKDLVFVSFELAGYADAVKRKQSGAQPQECR